VFKNKFFCLKKISNLKNSIKNEKLLLKYQIDDLLDAFPVHFGGGVIGILFAPMFMYDGIWYYKGIIYNFLIINIKIAQK